jgi:sulfur carrier protein ThiS adenylyltransferase
LIVYVNEKKYNVPEKTTVLDIKHNIKKDADIVIYNSFPIKENMNLKENDKIVLIKKGEVPSKEELECALVSRHTPFVHEKLKKYTVAIAGLGGLGSNAAIFLARVGIGKLILIDYDVVEPSNLNRQQYFIKHIGMKKTEAIKDIIKNCNPYVELETRNEFIDENNINSLFKDADIVIEALDDAKYKALLVNFILQKMKDKIIIASSGMAGYFSSNTIVTEKIMNNFYLVGDKVSESKPGCGLMAPRVAIAASHQANAVLRIILENI